MRVMRPLRHDVAHLGRLPFEAAYLDCEPLLGRRPPLFNLAIRTIEYEHLFGVYYLELVFFTGGMRYVRKFAGPENRMPGYA